jgi:hypothetical protein
MRGYFVRPRQATYVFVYTKRYHVPNQIRFWLGEFWPKLQQISGVLSDRLSAISETRLFGNWRRHRRQSLRPSLSELGMSASEHWIADAMKSDRAIECATLANCR